MSLMRLWAVAKKEALHIRRDRPSLVISFVLPVAMLFLFGYAVTTDVDEIKTAVLDADRTKASRELVTAFSASGYFNVTAYPLSRRDVEKLITGGKVKAAIVIPAGYARSLARGDVAPVQPIIDGSEPTTARTVLQAGELIARAHSRKLMLTAIDKSGRTIPLAGDAGRGLLAREPHPAHLFSRGPAGHHLEGRRARRTNFTGSILSGVRLRHPCSRGVAFRQDARLSAQIGEQICVRCACPGRRRLL